MFATLTLVFTAWSLGGYQNWSLHLLFLGGLGTFLASVMPMPRSWNGNDRQHGNFKNCYRLFRQPFFWPSLFFLCYIITQYLNPSIVQVFGEKSWWVEFMVPPLGSHLPSSVKADYNTMNALRTFVIQASAIALALGIIVGIRRRKTALVVLWSFVISGVSMSFVAILQKLTKTWQILWFIDASFPYPKLWGTFFYRNQGAAFLLLVLVISALLYFFYFKKSTEKLSKSGPHFLFFIFTLLLYSSVWLSLSRGAILVGSLLMLVFFTFIFWHNLIRLFRGGSLILSIIFLVGLIIWGIFILQFSDWSEVEKRVEHFEEIINNIETYDRTLSTKATWDMAQDRILYGWGAGSYRYIFPIYQQKYENIWYHSVDKNGSGTGRKLYLYAHNDWVQFLAEFGVVGSLFILAMFLCLSAYAMKLFYFTKSAAFIIFCGLLLIFTHNAVDFIFSSPSYWVAFWGSLFLIIRLIELEINAKNRTNRPQLIER